MRVVVDLLENTVSEVREDVEKEEKEKLLDYYFQSSEDERGDVEESKEKEKKEKWNPKTWKIEYEKVVMYDLMGLKGYEIAEKMNLTPQHVYNILGTDQAIAIQKALVNRIRTESFDISKEIKEIQELTVKRLKDCLKKDEIFATSRMGFISKGIDVMKGTGEHLKNAPTQVVNNQFTIPPSVADRFLEGLEKSDRARALLSSNNNNNNNNNNEKGREIAVIEDNGKSNN